MACMNDGCICHFESRQAWCDHRNAAISRSDLMWKVGEAGDLYLTDSPGWSAAHAKEIDRRTEDERKRFNWRLLHPLTTTGEE